MPTWTKGAAGNLLGSTVLTTGAANSATTSDITAKVLGRYQFENTFSANAPAGTTGLQVQIFDRVGSTPATDTEPLMQFIIPSANATTKLHTIELPSGQYAFTLTNTDTAHSTTTSITLDTMDTA